MPVAGFPRIDYLHWIEGRPGAAEHDLATSDLRAAPPDGRAVVPEDLADLPDPPADGPDLRGMVADAYGVAEANVLLTAGASMANALAAATALDVAVDGYSHPALDPENLDADPEGGDDDAEAQTPRVLVERPGYEPLVETPRALGATVDRFRRPVDEAFPLDPDRVAAACTPETALVTVTNRHNPSGRLADRDRLDAVVTAADRESGARTLVDEVYGPFVVGDEPAVSDAATGRSGAAGAPADGPAGAAGDAGEAGDGGDAGDAGDGGDGGRSLPAVADLLGMGGDGPAPDGRGPFDGVTAAAIPGAVVTGSLTKFHGLGGLRVGWLVADESFVEAARKVERHLPALSAPGAALGRRALYNRETLTGAARTTVAENAALLRSFVDDREDLAGPHFAGSTYAFLAHDEADGDAVAAAAADRGVLVVPGRFFEVPGRFRVSLGRDAEANRAALSVLGETLDSL